jgi:outer membrane protein assembly factor BamD
MRHHRLWAMVFAPMRTRLLLLALLPLLACTSKHVTLTGELKYGKTAEEDYQAGVDELEHSNWVEAQKFLEHVRAKYPFSKYAALAELRLADAKFKQDRFVEAADAYQRFVQLHPTHEEVDYAAFREALSQFRDAPVDFALFPPAYEKDQRSLGQAVAKLKAFVKERPDSKLRPEAQELLGKAQGRLAAHEWYVAEFYWKRERWAGAAGRLEGLVRDYPGSPNEPEALWRLAQACVKLEETHRARTALQKLITRHPQDPRRPQAEALLASLRP